MKSIKNHKDLESILDQLIKDSQNEVLRLINYGILNLFWEVGEVFNLAERKRNQPSDHKTFCSFLVINFGPFFSLENLFLMQKFSKQCSLETKNIISSYVSWEYIPMLTRLSTQQAWIHFSSTSYASSLTPQELNSLIENHAEGDKNEKLVLNEDMPILAPIGVKKYFSFEMAASFNLLFEPKNINLKFSISNDFDNIYNLAYNNIINKIINFQKHFNVIANANINLSFWKIGKSLVDFSKTSLHTTEIFKLSKKTSSKLGELFDEKWLSDCIEFSEQYPNPGEGVALAKSVKWESFNILLSIKDHSEQYFYANLISNESLTEVELLRIIAAGSHKNGKLKYNSYECDERRFSTAKNIELIISSVSHSEISVKNDNLHINIFKNPFLLEFLKSAT